VPVTIVSRLEKFLEGRPTEYVINGLIFVLTPGSPLTLPLSPTMGERAG